MARSGAKTDGLVALPLLVALFALLSERYALGGVGLALAILLKPQPVIFVPLVVLYLWRWTAREQFLRFAVAGLLTILVFLLPVLVPHFQLGDMLRNMQAESYNDSRSLSSDAFNFWWLIGFGHRPIGSTLLGIKSGILGDALFGAVSLICGIQIWRHREPIYLFFGLATQLFGFFMFMGGQHERYLFLFIPLALASLVVVRRARSQDLILLSFAGTVLCFLNMLVGVGGGLFANSQFIPYATLPALGAYLLTNFGGLSMTLAVLHLAAFIYALYVFLTGQFAPIGREEVALGSASLAGRGGVPHAYPPTPGGRDAPSWAGASHALAATRERLAYVGRDFRRAIVRPTRR